jgi:hypothetical protein
MNSVYALLLIGLIILSAAAIRHRGFNFPLWLKLSFSSGIGYMLLGVAFGPIVLNIINASSLDLLDPLINLAIGWVGLVLGLQLKFRDIKRITWEEWLGSFTQFAITASLITISAVLLFWWLGLADSTPIALCLGMLGGASSPTLIGMMAKEKGLTHSNPEIRRSLLYANLDGMFATVGLGLVWSIFFPHPEFDLEYGFIAQILLPIALGLLLGWIFHFFLSRGMKDAQMAMLIFGMVIFCGGVAAVSNISPIYLNLFVGIWLINQCSYANHLYRFLVIYEQSLLLGLLLMAGLLWDPGEWWLILLLVVFVISRILGKSSAWLYCKELWEMELNQKSCTEINSIKRAGWITMPQGGVALAIAISHSQLIGESGYHTVLSVTVPAVMIFAIFSNLIARIKNS